jgi:hypothetical protein
MGWTDVTTAVAGTVYTAARRNAEVRDNLAVLRGGGIAIANQAALDFLSGASASQLARLAHGTGRQSPRMNAAASAWEFASIGLELLHAASGTDANAGAANVDTFALASRLSRDDSLLVFTNFTALTQQVAGPHLYNSTDAVLINDLILGGSNAAAGSAYLETMILRNRQASAVGAQAATWGRETAGETWNNPTFVTAWAGAWTLAFRHNGVTAGGTFQWRWAIYQLMGQ